jgi:hypothetical protein
MVLRWKPDKEHSMDIVYAAEIPSIAGLLSEHVKRCVNPREIVVEDNPDETGSVLIRWRRECFVLSPGGMVDADIAG